MHTERGGGHGERGAFNGRGDDDFRRKAGECIQRGREKGRMGEGLRDGLMVCWVLLISVCGYNRGQNRVGCQGR